MKILSKEHFNSELQLPFSSEWPQALPLAAWGEYLLSPESNSQFAIDYSQEADISFINLIKDIFPQLSLVEHSQLYVKWMTSEALNKINGFSWEQFFQSYNLRWCENLKNTLLSLQQLDDIFLSWAHQKKCMQNDLAPLRRIKNIEKLSPHLNALAQLNPTKTQGAQLIDMICDLVELEEHEKLQAAFNTNSLKTLSRVLTKLRYPMSSEKAENKAAAIKNWPWPLHTEAKWTRRGDKAGIEIKIFVSSQEEFQKKIQGLQHVVNHSEIQEESGLW